MFIINEYVRPSSVEEAYNLLKERKDAVVLGGGTYLRLGSKKIGLAVDLSECGLKYIEKHENEIHIGAMTSFRDIETSVLLEGTFNGILPYAVSHILGVQFRNMVTVGGSVNGRYGFSDFITALLVLNTHVVLHRGGRMQLEEFLGRKAAEKDIIEKIIIMDDGRKAAFRTLRNSATDFAILDAAASVLNGDWKITIGVRPAVAALSGKAMDYLSSQKIDDESAAKAGEIASEELAFGSDIRASGEYRKEICKVLVKRAVLGVAQ